MNSRIRSLLIVMLLSTFIVGCSVAPKNSSDTVIEPSESKTTEGGTSDAKLEAIAKSPAKPEAVYDIDAVAAFEQANSLRDMPDKALALYQEAIAIDSTMEPAWFNMARMHYDAQDEDNLKRVITEATDKGAVSARMINLLGNLKRQQGLFTEAATYYDQALAINENHLSSLANKAIIIDIYQHDPAAALPWYEKYQTQLAAQGKDDPRVKNWIADLKQRLR